MDTLRPPRVGVVADDITGSGDIGIMFAKHGHAVRVFGAETDLETLPGLLANRRCDVAIVDTDSRFDAPDIAYRKVRAATRALQRWGAELFVKKTCSVFRGNVGREFDAMLDELGDDFGVAVAAFPKNGRATRGGVHFVHGKLLAESEFARDPVHPRTESNLVVDLQRQTQRGVRSVPLPEVRAGDEALRHRFEALQASGVSYALCDAETQEDLACIARAVRGQRILLGSSGLAEELPATWPAPAPYRALEGLDLGTSRGVLAVAGSVMPQSQAQLRAFETSGRPVFALPSAELLRAPEATIASAADRLTEALTRGEDAAVRSENNPDAVAEARALGATMGLDAVTVSRRVSEALARVAQAVLERTGGRRLVVLGGDTSAAVTRRLGIRETVVLEEIAPGLPSSLVPGERPLLLVLKSGSFGSQDFVLRAIEHLRGLGAQG